MGCKGGDCGGCGGGGGCKDNWVPPCAGEPWSWGGGCGDRRGGWGGGCGGGWGGGWGGGCAQPLPIPMPYPIYMQAQQQVQRPMSMQQPVLSAPFGMELYGTGTGQQRQYNAFGVKAYGPPPQGAGAMNAARRYEIYVDAIRRGFPDGTTRSLYRQHVLQAQAEGVPSGSEIGTTGIPGQPLPSEFARVNVSGGFGGILLRSAPSTRVGPGMPLPNGTAVTIFQRQIADQDGCGPCEWWLVEVLGQTPGALPPPLPGSIPTPPMLPMPRGYVRAIGPGGERNFSYSL